MTLQPDLGAYNRFNVKKDRFKIVYKMYKLILARNRGQPDDAGDILQYGHHLQSSSLQDLEGYTGRFCNE